jgi:hypothetical protein
MAARRPDYDKRLLSALDRSEKYSAQYQRALDKADAAKSKGWRSRYLKEAQRAERLGAKADADLAQLSERAARLARDAERREKARRQERRRSAPKRKAITDRHAADLASAFEYELGIDYNGARGASRGSAVAFNIRIARNDGQALTMKEAQDVARQLHKGATGDEIGGGYKVTGIDWARPGRAAREGSPSDVESFSSIMRTVGLSHWRIGGIKE